MVLLTHRVSCLGRHFQGGGLRVRRRGFLGRPMHRLGPPAQEGEGPLGRRASLEDGAPPRQASEGWGGAQHVGEAEEPAHMQCFSY